MYPYRTAHSANVKDEHVPVASKYDFSISFSTIIMLLFQTALTSTRLITIGTTSRRFISTSWSNYQFLLHSRPYLSNCLTAAALMFVGDVAAQKLSNDGKKYDPARTVAMVVSSALVMPPYIPFMRFLDRAFTASFSGSVKKSLFNAATAGVVSNAWMIFASTFIDSLLRGEPASVAKRLSRTALTRKIVGVAGNSASFWVPVNTVTFWMCGLDSYSNMSTTSRRTAEVLLMILLTVFTCGAWSNNGPALEWLTVLIFFFAVYITDLVFFPIDKRFIHDPFYSTYSKLTDPHYEVNPYN